MTIKELFEGAIEQKMIDLQALIIFLTLEKQVLSMDDSADKLDLYFLPKHRKRMNKLIGEFKQKMNMKYGLYIFQADEDYYISAKSEEQAKYIAFQNGIYAKTIKPIPENALVWDGYRNVTLKALANNKVGILGGN